MSGPRCGFCGQPREEHELACTTDPYTGYQEEDAKMAKDPLEPLEELDTREEWLRRRAEKLATAIGLYGTAGPLHLEPDTVDGLAAELRTVLEDLLP